MKNKNIKTLSDLIRKIAEERKRQKTIIKMEYKGDNERSTENTLNFLYTLNNEKIMHFVQYEKEDKDFFKDREYPMEKALSLLSYYTGKHNLRTAPISEKNSSMEVEIKLPKSKISQKCGTAISEMLREEKTRGISIKCLEDIGYTFPNQ